jgi:hypothetical protein
MANLSGIRLVEEVVENEETRQATCRLAIFVIGDFLSQQ